LLCAADQIGANLILVLQEIYEILFCHETLTIGTTWRAANGGTHVSRCFAASAGCDC